MWKRCIKPKNPQYTHSYPHMWRINFFEVDECTSCKKREQCFAKRIEHKILILAILCKLTVLNNEFFKDYQSFLQYIC